MDEKIVEYAPIIIVILGFIWQNNIFVKPEQLEKKHREIVNEVTGKIKDKYVELNAYKEFQNHIYSKLDEVSDNIEDLKNLLMEKD